ncbi:MlaD family protein [Pseudanabaena sp. PCC 6802]|uniref:MlaD family protein n=1 Tax=Pseudanabaena sp. PCC 6802 TaxID=118173 RepID=UPI0003495C38|nr:MlaD family protein [Pseudanabaena sp. PCC 6802]
MQARTIREGTLGLLIVAGVAVFGGGLLWLRGFRPGGGEAFSFVIDFKDASGLGVGSPVRFRGVQVGKVQSLQAESAGVKVSVTIDNPKLVIPRNSIIETNQSGFLNNTAIDIFPKSTSSESTAGLDPLSQNCDRNAIICRGSTIEGTTGVNFTQVVRETSQTLRKLNDNELLTNLNNTLKSTDEAAKSFKTLAQSATRLINSFQGPVSQFSTTAESIRQAANSIGQTASRADALMLENKERLAQTLDGISAAAKEAKALIANTRPLLEDGKFVANLQKLSENAAETAANLRQLSSEVNNPNTLTALRETLDSARATFANTQKITADLDELTGDPKFRSNIRNLVNGLSGLLSSAPNVIPPVASPLAPENSQESTLIAKTKKSKDNPNHKSPEQKADPIPLEQPLEQP